MIQNIVCISKFHSNRKQQRAINKIRKRIRQIGSSGSSISWKEAITALRSKGEVSSPKINKTDLFYTFISSTGSVYNISRPIKEKDISERSLFFLATILGLNINTKFEDD
ncbi:MAG: hypothetical protein SFU25_06930 [Candidatus Caenarcaniphilales bacterium]|nr:hypothetical protein [Candidatus Caenarcaniphilales bacterium]